MKKIIFVLVALLMAGSISNPTWAQTEEEEEVEVEVQLVPVDSKTKLITYQEVVDEEGTANDFFNRAVNWVNNTYKNPTSVTSVRDPHSGIIEGNYRFRIYKATQEENVDMEWGTILYSFKLEFKEGRYRYSFTNFLLKAASRYPLERWLNKDDLDYNTQNVEKLQKVNEFMVELTSSLKTYMKPVVEIEEESW